ncbi:lysis system i-spanin subunit Rz [Candidatus Williamhamiltonella defendens]|uniref:lysis system i-spanin subunit Rz n=1 Tax=Candidatus Williamhamiltonella defendens TaxID=138072 RepID=UPI0020C6DD36|nr:lysis system i-spanin subunit Rz [Candidatus Hamiltonella defensa]
MNKNLVAQLEHDVAASRRRLHIKAICSSLSANTTPSGLDDAASAKGKMFVDCLHVAKVWAGKYQPQIKPK